MKVTTREITKLRERTGAGLLACKKALEAAHGNIEEAITVMRNTGQILAERKSTRNASEGLIIARVHSDACAAVMLEINSETDFVANTEPFKQFAAQVVECALTYKAQAIDALLTLSVGADQTVEQARQALITKTGENIQIRRIYYLETKYHLGCYVHKGRYGCLVELEGASPEIAKDLAIQVVATQPEDQEALLSQDFIKAPSKTVRNYIDSQGGRLIQFIRFVLGEEA